MHIILISNKSSLSAYLSRALPEVSLHTFPSLTSVPAELQEEASLLIIDETTVSLMQLVDVARLVNGRLKLIILTEKSFETVECLDQASVLNFPICSTDVREYVAPAGKISA